MKNCFHITKYFFKKNRKSIISFGLILLIATLMFTSAITINLNISKSFDKKFEDLNSANSMFTIPSIQYSDEIIDKIKNIKDIDNIEVISGIYLTVPVEMNDSNQDQNQIFYNIDEVGKINKYNIYKESDKKLENEIYIPYYLYTNSKLDIDKKYEFKAENKSYSFNIKGIIEEMGYGNYSSSVLGIYVDNDTYNYLRNNNIDKEVKTISIKSNDSEKTYNEVSKLLTKNNISIINKNIDKNKKQSRLSVSNILVLILVTFSIIILLISLFVTKFKIKQTILEDITNMGILKALGYKNKQIIAGLIIPYLLTTIVISIIGTVLSIPVINTLAEIISSQAGFVFKPSLGILEILITILINIILVITFSYASANKINKLNPINAIRGITNNSNNKNHFPIEKTTGKINVILSLKNFANSISSNILLGIILFFLTLLSSFVISLFFNVNLNPINFVNTLVEEHPTIMIKVNDDIKDNIKKINDVDRIMYYEENGETNLKDNSYKTFIAENYDYISNDLIYEGSNPKNENEIALGSAIVEKFDYKIGDLIELSKNGITSTYKVVGFMQSVNYAGEVIEITLDGYKKLDEFYVPTSLYIYTEDETIEKANDLIDKIENKYSMYITSTINYVESLDSAASMFLNLIKLIAVVIIIITLLIIYLILNILLSGIIQNKKQELGILKAVGYKTSDLIYQTVGGLLPSTLIFITLGLIVSKITMSNIFNMIFKMVGVYKVNFEYPLYIFILVALFLIIGTIIISIMLCKKIKKITVYSLIKD